MNSVTDFAGEIQSQYKTVDLRNFPECEQNLRVFQAFESVSFGTRFRIVSNGYPLALFRQFQGELRERFEWQILQDGPYVWQVLITKNEKGKLGRVP